MARTLVHAADASVLLTHIKDEYHAGPYTYSLARDGHQVRLSVSHGGESRSTDLQWAFGSGEVGQSYLWTNPDGTLREARFNYFASLNGFAATPGRLHGPPVGIEMAIGRQIEPFEAKTCFGCHATGLTASAGLSESAFTPGVTCEACHGPGLQHVKAMQSADAGSDTHIVSPAHMTPAESVDFCGACHSTPWDVKLMGATGVDTVRSPAYRLEKSRCWGTQGDARLTCQSCHDPHAPLQRNLASYDNACLACHTTNKQIGATMQHPGKACPVANTQCVTCHMQRYEVPEMHAKFTDHMIRVARANEPFPD